MRTAVVITLLAALGGAGRGLAAQSPDGRPKEDRLGADPGRELVFTLELPEPPEALFHRWTTESEARRFLAEEVRIEPRVGGRYETLFDPEHDPAGALAGTYGSKIVALEPPSRLVFQWNCPTPRAAAEEVGGRRVLQESLVEVRFDPAEGNPDATRLRIRHFGIGEGPDWDASYRFYRDRGWPWIVGRLESLYGDEVGGP